MKREDYIKIRLSGQVPLELLFEYYLNNVETKLITDFGMFAQAMNMFVNMFSPDFKQFWLYYDNLYNINILRDKNNSIIKVY